MIELFDNYVIVVEDNGYALAQKFVSKNGKEYTRVLAYLGSVEKCLEFLGRELEHEALSGTFSRLDTAVATIRESHERLVAFLRDNLPEYKVVKAE